MFADFRFDEIGSPESVIRQKDDDGILEISSLPHRLQQVSSRSVGAFEQIQSLAGPLGRPHERKYRRTRGSFGRVGGCGFVPKPIC